MLFEAQKIPDLRGQRHRAQQTDLATGQTNSRAGGRQDFLRARQRRGAGLHKIQHRSKIGLIIGCGQIDDPVLGLVQHPDPWVITR